MSPRSARATRRSFRWTLPHHEQVLPSGLRVIVVPRESSHRAVVTMLFRVGSRFENAENNGISHFLEHMLYRGTPSYKTAHAQALAFEQLGASLYAATQSDYGTMNLSLPPESLAKALPIFAEVVQAPRFSAIEVERGIVREEILEDLDEEGRQIDADNLSRQVVYPSHPLGFTITGPVEHLATFDKRALNQHHARHYNAANAVLCFAGQVDASACFKLARRLFADLPTGQRVESVRPANTQKKARLRHVDNVSSQTTLRVAFRAVGDDDRREPALEMLLRVLDDGMSTRLYERLCDTKGLCYDVGALYESYEDDGVFDVAAEAQHDRAGVVLREILNLLRELSAKGPSADELERAKDRDLWSTQAMLDDVDGLSNYYALAALADLAETPAQRHEQLRAVTARDVRDAAELVFRAERMSVITVGAQSAAQRDALRATVDRFAKA